MGIELKLYEELQLTGRLFGKFACEYSEDGRILILTTSGVYVLELLGYVTNQYQQFSFRKDYFTLTDYTPSKDVILDVDNIIEDLTREQIYETIFRIDLSGHIDGTVKIDPRPLSAVWSPRGIYLKTDCILGVLSNLYCLEIFIKHIDKNDLIKYKSIVNVSRTIAEYFKKLWVNPTIRGAQELFCEYKNRVEAVTPTAFTWSHVCNSNGNSFIILFVGHLNGSVTAWRINAINTMATNEQIKLDFINKQNLCDGRITQLNWYKTKGSEGALTVANEMGKVNTVTVSNMKDNIRYSDNTELWTDCDKINVNYIKVIEHNNITYVFLVKERYFVIYAISRQGEVFCEKIVDVCNMYITAIKNFENSVYLITVSGLLKKLTVICKNNEIDIEEVDINIKIDSNKFNTAGFVISPNEVLFGVLLTPRRFSLTTRGKKFIHIHFFRNTSKNPLMLLLDNKRGTLRDHWDCLEVIRLESLKERKFPWHGISPDLNYDKLSLQQIKVLRLIAKISEKIFQVVPYIKQYDIKPFILLHYMVDIKLTVQRIKKLLQLRSNGQELSIFQMRSLDICNLFLKEMVMKDIIIKAELGETFINEIYEVMQVANELRYPDMPQCFWCGEKIIGPSCIPPHTDTRCAISMMPILLMPGYKCPFCKCLVHKEIEKEIDIIFCPYCDVPMYSRCFSIEDDEIEDTGNKYLEMAFSTNPPDTIDLSCIESIDIDDIEENTTEYLILSGSEEDYDDVEELRQLYHQTTIQDITKDATINIIDNNEEQIIVINDDSVDEKPKVDLNNT